MSTLRLRTKVWLEYGGEFVIGEGGLDLLAGIARSGSLTRAACDLGWSYRHAWGYVRRAERALRMPLTRSVPGKGRNRGMALTAAGERLVSDLTDAQVRVCQAGGAIAEPLQQRLVQCGQDTWESM